jgi:hypothetical protein
MTRGQQPAGDYGYDLTHEEFGGARVPDVAPDVVPDMPPDVRSVPEQVGTPPTGGPVGHDADFGYDEAHDF